MRQFFGSSGLLSLLNFQFLPFCIQGSVGGGGGSTGNTCFVYTDKSKCTVFV